MAYCEECGGYFRRGTGEHWKKLCFNCWRVQKNSDQQEIERLEERIEELEAENWRLRSQMPAVNMFDELRNKPLRDFILSNLKFLIFACHPDRNAGREEAGAVTRFLLDIKERARGGNAGFPKN